MAITYPRGSADVVRHAFAETLTSVGVWEVQATIDFTAEGTVDFDPAAGPLSIAGYSWTVRDAASISDIDTVNGTGLVITAGAVNEARTDPAGLYTACSNIVTYSDLRQPIFLEAVMTQTPNVNSDYAGIAIGNEAGPTFGAILVGQTGGAASVESYRKGNPTNATTASAAADPTALAIMKVGHAWRAGYALGDGSNFATSYTWFDSMSSTKQVSSAVDMGTDDVIYMIFETGNTAGTYAPVFKKLRIWTLSGAEQP